jgi:large subunit ribosomal protein L22
MTGPKTNEREGTRAFLRGAPVSAFKVRPVLDLIRGQEVGRAAEILTFCERGPAEAVGKLLASAVANAANNDELDPDELFVSACYADEGRTARRMRPRARGRATRIRKRSAHITIIVGRLPEERLARLRAQRAAEQAARRARRGRGTPERGRRRRPGEAESAVDAGIAEAAADAVQAATTSELADAVVADEAVAADIRAEEGEVVEESESAGVAAEESAMHVTTEDTEAGEDVDVVSEAGDEPAPPLADEVSVEDTAGQGGEGSAAAEEGDE